MTLTELQCLKALSSIVLHVPEVSVNVSVCMCVCVRNTSYEIDDFLLFSILQHLVNYRHYTVDFQNLFILCNQLIYSKYPFPRLTSSGTHHAILFFCTFDPLKCYM